MNASPFRIVSLTLASLLLAMAPAAFAMQILPTASPSPKPSVTAPGGAIDALPAIDSDARIAQRIRGIFSQLPSLVRVTVQVRQGVVTLGGRVEDATDKARAEGIAGRVSGVVTVENQISRDTSVGGGVARLKKVSEKFAAIAGELPLFGATLLVALLIAAIGYFIAGLGGVWRRVVRNASLAELIASAIRFAFVLGGIVVALDMIGAGALLGAVLGGRASSASRSASP